MGVGVLVVGGVGVLVPLRGRGIEQGLTNPGEPMVSQLIRVSHDVAITFRDGAVHARNYVTGDCMDLDAPALTVLADLVEPVPWESATARVAAVWELERTEAEGLLEQYLAAHLLELVADTPLFSRLLASYEDLDTHRMMLADEVRNDAFVRAIQAVVKPGDRVLDLGTGTGVLAVHAAWAGAAAVTAVEASSVARVAQRVVAANDAPAVKVLEAHVEEVILDAPVDVLISEWLGHFGLWEGMIRPVLDARDRWLAPGGRMLPARLELWMAPMASQPIARCHGPAFWERPVAGLDYREVAKVERRALQSRTIPIPGDALACPGQPVASLELAAITTDDLSFDTELVFELPRDARIDGLAGWFVADLGGGVVLNTSPFEPLTHWRQQYFALDELPSRTGDRLRVRLQLLPMDSGRKKPPSRLVVALERDGRVVQQDDRLFDAD